MTPDIKYWVALSRIPNLGTVRFRRLEAHFGALDQAWKAGSDSCTPPEWTAGRRAPS